MKSVTYSKLATKVLNRIQPKLAARIMDKIDQFAADPLSQANNVKALVGFVHIRLRVGDWRVIMNDQGIVLYIVEIGPRGGVYE
jgi:mRNA interferase RelE/StbE